MWWHWNWYYYIYICGRYQSGLHTCTNKTKQFCSDNRKLALAFRNNWIVHFILLFGKWMEHTLICECVVRVELVTTGNCRILKKNINDSSYRMYQSYFWLVHFSTVSDASALKVDLGFFLRFYFLSDCMLSFIFQTLTAKRKKEKQKLENKLSKHVAIFT